MVTDVEWMRQAVKFFGGVGVFPVIESSLF
jgi:hypothetical protein